jgi:HD-GYP domain-containing protein (c-di-GMP phosphodiesterase class II)
MRQAARRVDPEIVNAFVLTYEKYRRISAQPGRGGLITINLT